MTTGVSTGVTIGAGSACSTKKRPATSIRPLPSSSYRLKIASISARSSGVCVCPRASETVACCVRLRGLS